MRTRFFTMTIFAVILLVSLSCTPDEDITSESTNPPMDENLNEYNRQAEMFWSFFGGPTRVICEVYDDGSVYCMTISDLTATYLEFYGVESGISALDTFQEIINILEQLGLHPENNLVSKSNDAIILCPGGVALTDITSDILPSGAMVTWDDFTPLSSYDQTQIKNLCIEGLKTLFLYKLTKIQLFHSNRASFNS